jgi:hypothetical protein
VSFGSRGAIRANNPNLTGKRYFSIDKPTTLSFLGAATGAVDLANVTPLDYLPGMHGLYYYNTTSTFYYIENGVNTGAATYASYAIGIGVDDAAGELYIYIDGVLKKTISVSEAIYPMAIWGDTTLEAQTGDVRYLPSGFVAWDAAGAEFLSESVSLTEQLYLGGYSTFVETASVVTAASIFNAVTKSISDEAGVTDSTTHDVIQWFFESIAANETTTNKATTGLSYTEQVAAAETLVALFNQLVADSASGAETWYIDTAAMIAEVSVASGITTSQITAIQALAEVIVALELQQSGGLETISESAAAATTVSNLVRATQAILEQAVAADTQVSYLILVNTVSETALADETVSLWQSLTQAIEDGATAFVHLSVGGEVYTGWVMNTNNNAVTEYQGLNFNSLCKLGNRYFGASSGGVYEITGTQDSGTDISIYIQSGVMDFGTSYDKAIPYAYLGADIDGRLALGVRVSEKSGPAEFWYEVTMTQDAVGNVKIPIGKGLKGRYWKFEVASEALSSFDMMSVLPVVLTRRV